MLRKNNPKFDLKIISQICVRVIYKWTENAAMAWNSGDFCCLNWVKRWDLVYGFADLVYGFAVFECQLSEIVWQILCVTGKSYLLILQFIYITYDLYILIFI